MCKSLEKHLSSDDGHEKEEVYQLMPFRMALNMQCHTLILSLTNYKVKRSIRWLPTRLSMVLHVIALLQAAMKMLQCTLLPGPQPTADTHKSEWENVLPQTTGLNEDS